MAERIIGVDFGTSTSVIRVKRYGNDGQPIGERTKAEEVRFSDKGGMVPTLIRKKKGKPNVSYYGYEAEHSRSGYTLYHSFKEDLENPDPEIRNRALTLTEEFYSYMADHYRTRSEGGFFGPPTDSERTIISYPVKWRDETKQLLVETAANAGFPNVVGVDEAQAAIHAVLVHKEVDLKSNGLLRDGTPATILLIDMGAITTDLVLCRYTPGYGVWELMSTWPKRDMGLFGGQEVDCLLQNYFRSMLPPEEAEDLFRCVGLDKFKEWKEKLVSPTLLRGEAVTSFPALDIYLELMGAELKEYYLDRATFEGCLNDYLSQLPTMILDYINHSAIQEKDIDLVIITGGHSQWYFVPEMLLGKMKQFGELELTKIQREPERIITLESPQETVALGLALHRISLEPFDQTTQMEACFQKAEQCERDGQHATAFKWYYKAATQGLAKAQNELGRYYIVGKGREKDTVKAAIWFRKAAEQGFVNAQHNLGFCYEKGIGVSKDMVEAEKWYGKAAEQGDEDAKKTLKLMRMAKIHVVCKKRLIEYERGQFIRLDRNSSKVYKIANGDDYMIPVTKGTHYLQLAGATIMGNKPNWIIVDGFEREFDDGDVLLIDLSDDVKINWELED